MAESCFVRTAWRGDRKESPDQCAERAVRFFEELTRIDPTFARFEETRRRHGKYVQSPVPMDVSELAKLFAKGVNRRDSDRSVIAELGYSLWATTPGENHAWLRIHCGVYDSPESFNSCNMSLRFTGADEDAIINASTLARILAAMVDAFEPQVGCAGFDSYRLAVTPGERHALKERDVDWIMYFSREWGSVPPLPVPVRIVPVGCQGMLVILTPERISASNPEHVELGRRVRVLLGRAGLLNKLTE